MGADPNRGRRVTTDATTTGQLLADRAAIDAAAHSSDTVPVDDLQLISPITVPCRVVAQLTNYASHVTDAGRDPATTPLAFFRKASGSISGPLDDIIKPGHVRLLDYEVEIGLVIGRDVPVGTAITEANLAEYICGLAVANDVSARDVQLTKTQFYEAKSYPTFTPVRPALVVRRRRAQALRGFEAAAAGQRFRFARTRLSTATSSTGPCRRCRRCRDFSGSMPATWY